MAHRVLMNFMHYKTWSVHFIEDDCRTPVSPGRYFDFTTLLNLRNFALCCNPDLGGMEEFDHNVRAWGRGSIYVNLTEEQYAAIYKPKSVIKQRP